MFVCTCITAAIQAYALLSIKGELTAAQVKHVKVTAIRSFKYYIYHRAQQRPIKKAMGQILQLLLTPNSNLLHEGILLKSMELLMK